MFKITQVTQLLFFSLSILMMSINSGIGLAYFVGIAPLIVICSMIRKRNPFIFTPIYAAIISIFVFYFIRPFFLVLYPEFYPYTSPILVDEQTMITSLLMQGLFSAAYLLTLYCVIHTPHKTLKKPLNEMKNSRISQLGSSFILLLFMFSLMWFSLIFIFDIARKGISSDLEILRLILPVTLIIPALVGFLGVGATRRLSKVKKIAVYFIILLNVVVIVLTGSKAGIFLLALYVFFFLCLMKGNFKLPMIKTLLIVPIFLSLIYFSTVFANVIKYKGVSSDAISAFNQLIAHKELFLYIVDGITWRLNGFDGSIAVVYSHPPEFEKYVAWPSIFKQSAAQLLPGISTDKFSIGKAVGIIFDGRAIDQSHAGALGMFAIIFYQGGWLLGIIITSLIAIMFGTLYRKMADLTSKGAPERITACIVVLYLQAFWLSSGNFDKLIQQLVVTIVHMIFYYHLLGVFKRDPISHNQTYRKNT